MRYTCRVITYVTGCVLYLRRLPAAFSFYTFRPSEGYFLIKVSVSLCIGWYSFHCQKINRKAGYSYSIRYFLNNAFHSKNHNYIFRVTIIFRIAYNILFYNTTNRGPLIVGHLWTGFIHRYVHLNSNKKKKNYKVLKL